MRASFLCCLIHWMLAGCPYYPAVYLPLSDRWLICLSDNTSILYDFLKFQILIPEYDIRFFTRRQRTIISLFSETYRRIDRSSFPLTRSIGSSLSIE